MVKLNMKLANDIVVWFNNSLPLDSFKMHLVCFILAKSLIKALHTPMAGTLSLLR